MTDYACELLTYYLWQHTESQLSPLIYNCHGCSNLLARRTGLAAGVLEPELRRQGPSAVENLQFHPFAGVGRGDRQPARRRLGPSAGAVERRLAQAGQLPTVVSCRDLEYAHPIVPPQDATMARISRAGCPGGEPASVHPKTERRFSYTKRAVAAVVAGGAGSVPHSARSRRIAW